MIGLRACHWVSSKFYVLKARILSKEGGGVPKSHAGRQTSHSARRLCTLRCTAAANARDAEAFGAFFFLMLFTLKKGIWTNRPLEAK